MSGEEVQEERPTLGLAVDGLHGIKNRLRLVLRIQYVWERLRLGSDILDSFQCPCVRRKDTGECVTYDPRFQAVTVEEAILNFPDLQINALGASTGRTNGSNATVELLVTLCFYFPAGDRHINFFAFSHQALMRAALALLPRAII